jgi:hypothetical protein
MSDIDILNIDNIIARLLEGKYYFARQLPLSWRSKSAEVHASGVEFL